LLFMDGMHVLCVCVLMLQSVYTMQSKKLWKIMANIVIGNWLTLHYTLVPFIFSELRNDKIIENFEITISQF